MENIKYINQQLISRFGKYADGRPRWRVVWSEGLTEKRLGQFPCLVGDLLTGYVTEVREVKKYTYVKERFILEKLIFAPNPELINSENGHYEVVFIFWDKNCNYLKPLWKIVEFLVYMAENGRVEKKNASIMASEEQESIDKEILEFMDIIDNESPWLAGKLSDKEAVSMAGLNGKESK